MSSDPENILVFGFDIGNCFSGIALASTPGGITYTLPHVYPIDNTTHLKIPSVVKYDQDNGLVACGREAKQLGYSNGELVENFKRFLQLKYHQSDKESEGPAYAILTREKAIKVFLDFLGFLKDLVEQHVEEKSFGYDLEKSYFQFTLPTSYCAHHGDGLSLEDFKRIIVSEESPFQQYYERVIVKDESEAAAIHCILEYIKKSENQESCAKELIDQCILVWDAGYHNCELVSYRINSIHPLIKLTQDHRIFSDTGSIMIDNAFHEYLLEELPQKYKENSWDGFLETMASFRTCKESFKDRLDDEQAKVEVHLFPKDLPHPKNQNGSLILSGAKIRSFYTSTLPETLKSTINQIFHDTQERDSVIKVIFLVGGLGSSTIYEREIRNAIHEVSSAEIYKPEQAEAAICLGSVQSLLQEFPRVTYDKSWGILHQQIEQKPAHIGWFYDKGTILCDSSASRSIISYRLTMTKAELKNNLHELKLVSYNEDIATRPNFRDIQNYQVLPTCPLFIPIIETQESNTSYRQTIREWANPPKDSQQDPSGPNNIIVKIRTEFYNGCLRLTLSKDEEEVGNTLVIGEFKNANWISSAI